MTKETRKNPTNGKDEANRLLYGHIFSVLVEAAKAIELASQLAGDTTDTEEPTASTKDATD